MIRAILVDDERHNIELLSLLLTQYCPEIEILGHAHFIHDAYALITQKKPDIVFLDVKLQEGTGFDLLRKFSEIDFEVILISGFKEFAFEAFEFNAIDYVIKPIDIERLQKAIKRATNKLTLKEKPIYIQEFIQALDPKTEHLSKFKVHKQNNVIWIPFAEIVFLKAAFGNTQIFTEKKECYSIGFNIGKCLELLNNANYFLQLRKDIIINTMFLRSYTKGEPCFVQLKTGEEFEVSRRKKKEVLDSLKAKTGKKSI